jgi:hypothetical protein
MMPPSPPIPSKAPLLTGDSTSQLVQVTVRDIGMKNFKAAGNGAQDIRRLACIAYNATLTSEELWKMTRTLAQAIDQHKDSVPESFRAIVSAGILAARSNLDLGSKS